MRRRHPEADERLEREPGAPARAAADLGSIVQEGTGNAALASLMEQVESGAAPATALLPGVREEEEAGQALAAVDLARRPLAERTRRAITERTAIAKPGMLLYAREDFEALLELEAKLAELHKRLVDNATAAVAARGSLEDRSDLSIAYAKRAAATLAEDLRRAALLLHELEQKLAEIAARHAPANAEDRARLGQLMDGLEPRLRREPRLAMAGGAGAQQVDYLLKRAWLEQHEATQRLAKDELWQLVAGFPPGENGVCHFDVTERMDRWRIHFTLVHAAMTGVDVGSSDRDVRDALFGAAAAAHQRSHAMAEVLGRGDERNPRYAYGTSRPTAPKDLWRTREGKAVKRNWGANQAKLTAAFDAKADELVKAVHDVLEQRKELKAVVVKLGETLKWAG
jgi:hypothetical protein